MVVSHIFLPNNNAGGGCWYSAVLPRGRNFGRKAQKGPKKICWGRENQGPNFCPIYQKRAEKGPNFF
jgi:hypothetical protein